jgi:hypothetical protein
MVSTELITKEEDAQKHTKKRKENRKKSRITTNLETTSTSGNLPTPLRKLNPLLL